MKCIWCQTELKPNAVKCHMCGHEVDRSAMSDPSTMGLPTPPQASFGTKPSSQPAQAQQQAFQPASFQQPQQQAYPQQAAYQQPVQQAYPQQAAGYQQGYPQTAYAPQAYAQAPQQYAVQQPVYAPQPVYVAPVPMYGQPLGLQPRKNKGFAVAGLVLAILAMLDCAEAAIVGATLDNPSHYSRSQTRSLCSGWFTIYWFSLILLILAIVFLIVALVKKQSSAPKIVGICFAVLALILFVICTAQYDMVSRLYDKSRYGSYYDYIY